MTRLLIRRILNNKWLFICLLIGSLLTAAVVGAIPMYTEGIFQKVLVKDLEQAQMEDLISPMRLRLQVEGDLHYDANFLERLEHLETFFENTENQNYPLPVSYQIRQIRYNRLYIQRDGDAFINTLSRTAYPTAIDDLDPHVNWLYGGMPSPSNPDGVIEVVISEPAMKQLHLVPEAVYDLAKINRWTDEITPMLQFKVVGVFNIEDKNAPFWAGGRYDRYHYNLIMERGTFEALMTTGREFLLKDLENVIALDYSTIAIGDLEGIQVAFQKQMNRMGQVGQQTSLTLPAIALLDLYQARSDQLKITLWIVMLPLFIIMAFYAVLVSNLIIQSDYNEIAVLKSRGAKRQQIFMLYLMEALVIMVLTLLISPWLSVLICKMLGASNGFLAFVQREALQLRFGLDTFLYSLLATVVYGLFMMLPVIKASGLHIVDYKRDLVKKRKNPLWHRLYMDVVLIALSFYGLVQFKNRQDWLRLSGVDALVMDIDPLLFVIATCFIVGASLLFLRLYPFIIKIIFKIGERFWHPVTYFSLVNVSKSDKHLQAIMLFLILAVAFGLMSANQARTINTNTEHRIAYHHGADVVIEPYNNLLHLGNPPPMMGDQMMQMMANIPYQAPPFYTYEQLEGVETITKVYHEKDVVVGVGGKRIQGMNLYGITTNLFGEVSWFRNDLLPHHLNAYLNMLSAAPRGILLSENMQEAYDVRAGDTIRMQVDDYGTLEATVYGFVEHFPTYNPYGDDGQDHYFGVVNGFFIEHQLPAHPYEIWIKKSPGVTDTDILLALDTAGLRYESIRFKDQAIIQAKNDPLLLGTNGSLTMCFLIEMLVAAIGFLIFWMLSIHERKLKFGIFRAIGMPMGQVTMIMVMEQILVSFVAIVMGFVIGSLASQWFIPLLELVYNTSMQVPKFLIVADIKDYWNVFYATSLMMVMSLLILGVQIRKINVNQIIKLGEDS